MKKFLFAPVAMVLTIAYLAAWHVFRVMRPLAMQALWLAKQRHDRLFTCYLFYDRILKVENAGNGKTALISPGLNATYDKFILILGGGIVAADITEIRILANDAEVFKDTAANLDKRQAYQSVDTDVAEVVIDFTEPNARGDAAAQYLASLPANLLKKLTIEVDIAANQGGGEDFSNLKCAAEYRGPSKNPFILKRRKFVYSVAAAADHDLFLPSGVSGGIIKRVWLHHTGNITGAMLRIGNVIAQNYKTMAELTRIQERNGRVPQANISCLDFVVDGNLQGALNTAVGQDVRLTLTTDDAEVVTGYVDYIDPIGRLK